VIGVDFRKIARAATVLTIILGCSVVVGWVFGIAPLKSVLAGLVTMKMNTAVCFLLGGVSLGLQLDPPSARRERWRGRSAALLMATVGLATLLEHALGMGFGIDELLIRADATEAFGASPGRMAPNTALSFVLAGTALVLLDTTFAALQALCQWLALGVFLIGFVAVAGYSLNVAALTGVAGYTSMALHTAAGFIVLSTGILAARPQRGAVAILAQDNLAGAAIRRLLPLILVVPLAVGHVLLEGQRLGLYGSYFAFALMVAVTTSVIAALAVWNAHVHGALDAERRRASDQFRVAIEAAPTGMLVTDRAGRIVLLNVEAERLFGYGRKDLLGKQVESLVPARFRARHTEQRTSFLAEHVARPMGAGRELYGLRRDGAEVPVEIALTPLEGACVLSSIVDITERKRVEREREAFLGQLEAMNAALEQRVQARTADLTATLREREVLLQEVHHRVKNNLHVIVSLMEMQARLLRPGEGRDALHDCQGRVHAIALIHEKLYQSKDFANVPFAEYLRVLAGDVFSAAGASPSTVTLALAVDDVAITVQKAIPCALILNELITNALKHAYPGARAGVLRVELKRAAAGRLRLTIADDGVGLPSDFDIKHARSLGLKLVSTLAQQMDAELIVRGERGTSFELTFPVETAKT
jgi:PAS domain S-box-containing protein